MLHCDFRMRWKIASDLRAAIFYPCKTHSSAGILAIVCSVASEQLQGHSSRTYPSGPEPSEPIRPIRLRVRSGGAGGVGPAEWPAAPPESLDVSLRGVN